MKLNRRHFILAAGTGLVVAATKDLIQRAPAIAQQTAINLYTSRHYDTDEELYNGFTRATGAKVNKIEGTAEELMERVKSEGANTRADLLLTVDGGNLWRAKQEGLLQPINSSILNQKIPGSLRDPQGHWFAFSRRARVIMYNKNKVNPSQLSTYEDLADPKWKGKILIRSSNNIYNQSLTGSLLAAHGADKTLAWAKGMVANFARSPEGNDTAQLQACAAGVGDIAITNTYYLIRLGKSSKPEDRKVFDSVSIFFPNQTGPNGRGTHVNISGGGVVKHAKNKQAAIEFLEYLTSVEAQRSFAQGNNEYPVVSGAPMDSVLQKFGNFKADPLNPDVFGKNNAEALRIMDRAGWK